MNFDLADLILASIPDFITKWFIKNFIFNTFKQVKQQKIILSIVNIMGGQQPKVYSKEFSKLSFRP